MNAPDADLADAGISLSRAREGHDGARIIRLQWRVSAESEGDTDGWRNRPAGTVASPVTWSPGSAAGLAAASAVFVGGALLTGLLRRQLLQI